MRLLFAPILLILLPVLVVAHLQYYSLSLQEPLFAEAGAALNAPEFAQVKISLNYMDVTLKGRVADLATRERARQLVNGRRGLRCREQDNLLQITARLEGKLEGNKLLLSGWLHDEATLRDAVLWLTKARPGIEVVTSSVQVSQYVTKEDAPGEGETPVAFRPAWAAIEVPSSLKIQREGTKITLSGHLHSTGLRDAIVAAVTPDAAPETVDAAQLAAGEYVRDAKFAIEQLLPDFLRAFFSTPGAARFEAEAKLILVSAVATPTMLHEWQEMLEPLSRETELQEQIQVFPSVFHFPERLRESLVPAEILPTLQDVLRASVITFEPGRATPGAEEQPKTTAAASAIIAAGPDVRIVAGAYMDTAGNPKDNTTVARKRAEAVVADLVAKGVSSQALEAVIFETVPDDTDHERQVELLIK